eukprot:EG_transcript_16779
MVDEGNRLPREDSTSDQSFSSPLGDPIPGPPLDALLYRESSPDDAEDSDSDSATSDSVGEGVGTAADAADALALNEVELQSFKNGVKLFGLGRWVKMNAVGLLPGRGTADYVEICQRYLKQQSLSTVAGLHLDMDRLREHNLALIRELQETPAKGQELGLTVRNGVLVNVGGQLTAEERAARIAAHEAQFGLSEAEVQRLARDDAFLDETFRAKQFGLEVRERDLRATQRFQRRAVSLTTWWDPQLEDRFATWQALPTAELCHTLAAKQAELEVAKAEYFQWLTARKRQKCG